MHRSRVGLGVLCVSAVLRVPLLLLLRIVRLHGSQAKEEGHIVHRGVVRPSSDAHPSHMARAVSFGIRHSAAGQSKGRGTTVVAAI